MAAYAALVSVMHIIDNLQLHPRPPISLHESQVHLLTEKIIFLQEFLEGYNPNLDYSTEADPLEIHIADAAYAAEDVIETHIAEKMSSDALYEALEKVVEEMTLIKVKAMEIKGQRDQLQRNSTPNWGSSKSSFSIAQKSSMVGADDVLLELKDKLTSHRLDLQIIPIVGMGGTGKTTLAINIFQDRLIKEHFDICAWATISQEYSIRDILAQVVRHLDIEIVGEDLNEHEIGDKLYKHLYGRRYMIVMDDMWTIKACDGVRRFLPNNENGSRIVVTTRLSNLASELSNSNNLEMKPLDEANGWDLLSKTVFGVEGCPVELEEIGKQIGKSCKGLPLSIVVIGGLLAKSKHTREFWEYIEKNLSTIVNSVDDERCLKILHMSYKHLPIYLKPCFLYMGVYPEDVVICISKLIKLWVAEGFLNPIIGKSLEEVARLYLKELTDRNLVLIYKMGIAGNIKLCKIHDLLRDLCLRESQKERFYNVVVGQTTPQEIVNGKCRHVVIHSTTPNNEAINALSSSMSLVRSLTWNVGYGVLPPLNFRLLRILNPKSGFLENVHQLFNSRFLYFSSLPEYEFPSSIWLFWNLQTLIVNEILEIFAPAHFWYMPYIRHVDIPYLRLQNPPDDQDDIVLGNLQTLARIKNFKWSKQVIKRIPNIKKLKLLYNEGFDDDGYGLTNLDYLHKLESLHCEFHNMTNGSQISFPHLLKKLDLYINKFQCWEDILDNIGTLPLLHKLKLEGGCFREWQWETTEDQFRSLKFLSIRWCYGPKVWKTESSHFPCLEQLHLDSIEELEGISLDFAEISTLREINVYLCNDSVVDSVKRILEEQVDLYGEITLQVQGGASSINWRAGESKLW